MPTTYSPNGQETRHTDDMQDIITAVPSWLLRWGITLFFAILALIIGLSAFIRYPDIVKASLRIDSPNSPKPVVTKVAGKLVKLLVTEGESVSAGQSLAYLESTADHNKVLMLLANLKQLQQQVLQNKPLNTGLLTQADDLQLGELQGAYQTFYGEYLNYLSSVNNGFLLKKRGYLQKDLDDITKQQGQLNAQKTIEHRDLELAEQEYNVAKKLLQEKAETPTQFRQEESQYLAKKTPLVQTDASLINGNDNYTSKQKEILELDNDVQQEKSKFLQALNSLISSTEDWKSKYILTASVAGRVSFQGIIQENEVLQPNQDVFYVNPGNEQFYGDMSISQTSIGKVRVGEKVLIKLKGYPYEEFGMIRGTIKYIADIPYKDSVFMSRVDFKMKNSSDLKKPIHLKQGMTADAEIVTQDATILQRISWSLFKMEH
jgi:multidrug efflux pump subunit AcrA (membrane-fusion protein)